MVFSDDFVDFLKIKKKLVEFTKTILWPYAIYCLLFLNQDRDQGALPPQLGAAWRGQGQDHPGGGAYEDCGLAAFWLAHLWWAHKVSDSDNCDHTLWLTIMIVNYRTLERHKLVFQNQIP